MEWKTTKVGSGWCIIEIVKGRYVKARISGFRIVHLIFKFEHTLTKWSTRKESGVRLEIPVGLLLIFVDSTAQEASIC